MSDPISKLRTISFIAGAGLDGYPRAIYRDLKGIMSGGKRQAVDVTLDGLKRLYNNMDENKDHSLR
jgi:hypothetical protein